ncbi:DUF4040 domain-containing protein [Waterburya agarophytonicola K14]|uniref:DUF4040 domain-containing protein n=1 Tax=Waterburya agarophytonicola KI4 TaxID=2874699 RepID=A0A964BY21_9CYAN|nr:DUF4040 domain-containing protein [Waterburya agarophytonicola]MCC0179627.1 DUF4040 domain-containing protein [Waterburya agarophytonicola KI4]
MIDNYIYVIVALLPLSALILVSQTNPYNALVIRAILGAIAALVYSILGGADVALTEALVGTMLAVTLYVIAVRSSLVMRLGILSKNSDSTEDYFTELIANLRKVTQKYYLRLELVEYPDRELLKQALLKREVHGICERSELSNMDNNPIYQTTIRVHRLFEILQTEFTFPDTEISYITIPSSEDKHK